MVFSMKGLMFGYLLLSISLSLASGFGVQGKYISLRSTTTKQQDYFDEKDQLHALCSLDNKARTNLSLRNQRSSDDSGSIATKGIYSLFTGPGDQTIVGVAGLVASLIMLYSENVLKGTGCGLPAGPFGLVGAAEGISYLVVTGLGVSLFFSNGENGSGLFTEDKDKPLLNRISSPGGILLIAEGMCYLTLGYGLFVLAMQITNYGYIPNAVPMEGGMCQ